jgi:hypothetical protein
MPGGWTWRAAGQRPCAHFGHPHGEPCAFVTCTSRPASSAASFVASNTDTPRAARNSRPPRSTTIVRQRDSATTRRSRRSSSPADRRSTSPVIATRSVAPQTEGAANTSANAKSEDTISLTPIHGARRLDRQPPTNLTQRLHDRKGYSRASHPPEANQQHMHDQIVDQRSGPRTHHPARPVGARNCAHTAGDCCSVITPGTGRVGGRP